MRGYGSASGGVPGSPGTTGKTIRNGTGAPSGGLGVDGDFYLDTSSLDFYGPKTGGAWGSPISLFPSPTIEGTAGSQSLVRKFFQVVGTTTDDTAVVVDTGYAPPAGSIAHAEGDCSAADRTAHTGRVKDIFAAVKNYSGTVAILGTQATVNSIGDSALSTIACDLSVSSGTVHVTFTPPAAYSGTLDWLCNLIFIEN